MHIAYIVPNIETKGGVERVLSKKVNYFIENFGYKISIITFTQNKLNNTFFDFNKTIDLYSLEYKFSKGDIIKKIFLKNQYDKENLKSLQTIVDKIKPDIIISIYYPLSLFLKLQTSAIKIEEKHECRNKEIIFKKLNFLEMIKRNISILKYDLKKRELDKLIILTYQDLKYWHKRENIEIIPNPLTFETRDIAKLENKKIISVGRYNAQKGYDYLIEAWSLIEKKVFDWELEIYGDGELKEEYEQQIKRLGLKNIKLIPATSNIREKYLESSIYVMTSRYEGLPMVLLEAISCGLPIVSFDCQCGPAELISKENGYLVPVGKIEILADKIIKLIKNEELRKKMGEESKKISYKYSEKKIMTKWRELFENFRNENIKIKR